jgi:tRNA pseudouridine38-40 synthase
MSQRIALGIEYDGSLFHGWQSQPQAATVQDALEHALARIAEMPLRVHAAGRTDTGVHATGQVVHFDTPVNRPLSAWMRGVNAHLPSSVAVHWVREVAEPFHARFSAQARAYRYVLVNRTARPALWAKRVGWFHLPLDIHAMQMAANYLLGEHNFSAFRAAECQAKTPVKTIQRLTIQQIGEIFYIDIQADAFLHHMVRNIVGCLVYVGKGKYPPAWMGALLDSADRRLAAPTFAPDGLYLTQVHYAAEWNLPATAAWAGI